MPPSPTQPLDTALAYFGAWSDHRFEDAMRWIAPDIVCHSPAGLLNGAQEFRGFMEPFVTIMVNTDLLAAFGDIGTALLMYGTATRPVADAPAAELHVVRDGQIAEMRIIFDRAPFEAARQSP